MKDLYLNMHRQLTKNMRPWVKTFLGHPLTLLIMAVAPFGLLFFLAVWCLGFLEMKFLKSKLWGKIKSLFLVKEAPEEEEESDAKNSQ
jgi:Na+/pantothenate symporter